MAELPKIKKNLKGEIKGTIRGTRGGSRNDLKNPNWRLQAKAHPPGKPGKPNPEPSSPYLPGKSPHKRAKIKPHDQSVNA